MIVNLNITKLTNGKYALLNEYKQFVFSFWFTFNPIFTAFNL